MSIRANTFVNSLNSRQTLRRKFGRKAVDEGSKPAPMEDQRLVTISWEEHQNPSRDIHLLEIVSSPSARKGYFIKVALRKKPVYNRTR